MLRPAAYTLLKLTALKRIPLSDWTLVSSKTNYTPNSRTVSFRRSKPRSLCPAPRDDSVERTTECWTPARIGELGLQNYEAIAYGPAAQHEVRPVPPLQVSSQGVELLEAVTNGPQAAAA